MTENKFSVGDLVMYVNDPNDHCGLITSVDTSKRWRCSVMWPMLNAGDEEYWYNDHELDLISKACDDGI